MSTTAKVLLLDSFTVNLEFHLVPDGSNRFTYLMLTVFFLDKQNRCTLVAITLGRIKPPPTIPVTDPEVIPEVASGNSPEIRNTTRLIMNRRNVRSRVMNGSQKTSQPSCDSSDGTHDTDELAPIVLLAGPAEDDQAWPHLKQVSSSTTHSPGCLRQTCVAKRVEFKTLRGYLDSLGT
ncbi:hypothetical protein Tco_1476607 [Tanacetum coccineum]